MTIRILVLVVGYVFVYSQSIYLTFYDVSPDELILRKKQGRFPFVIKIVNNEYIE